MKRTKPTQPRHRVVRRNTRKRRLKKIFRFTEVRDLLVSVWAIRLIALNQSDAAQRFMRFPKELIGAQIGSKHYVAPWILETLTNEGLVQPNIADGRRKIDLTQFNNFSSLYNLMNELENAESLMDIPQGGITRAIPRLGLRQVTENDLIPVSFTHSDDLEVSLTRLPIDRLPSALARHAKEDRIGYSFRHVAEGFYTDTGKIISFDYDAKIVEHVAWWGDMRASFG